MELQQDRPGGAIAVTWDARRRRPTAFVWRRRRYVIHRVVRTWVIDTGWWSEETHVARMYWRVHAVDRLFDLSFDRLGKTWRMERIVG